MESQDVSVRLVVPAAAEPATPAPGPQPEATPSTGTTVPVSTPPLDRDPALPQLPRTGLELVAVLLVAVILLALGALLVRASGRRVP